MINETRKHPHYYKIDYTYSILTSKLSHTKTQENETITKDIILTANNDSYKSNSKAKYKNRIDKNLSNQ